MRLTASLLVLLLTMCLFTGCWSSRELSELAIVVGVGLDVGEADHAVLVTAQIAKASQMQNTSSSGEKSSGASKKDAYVNIHFESETVFDAVREMSRMLSRKPYFPHNQVIIIGQQLAERGIIDELDMFMREQESRMEMELLVVNGKASDALETTADMEPFPAKHIYESLNLQWANSKSLPMSVRKFAIDLLSVSSASMLPFMELYQSVEGEQRMAMQGMAAFSGDRMAGKLTPMETRGVLWVLGETDSGALLADTPNGRVSLEIRWPKAKIVPILQEDGSFAVKVVISCQATVSDSKTVDDFTQLPVAEYVQASASKVICREIEAALRRAKQLNTDVFGFGDAIHRAYAAEFRSVDWTDTFATLSVETDVQVTLINTGAITKPLRLGRTT